jgi:hypothetical protein
MVDKNIVAHPLQIYTAMRLLVLNPQSLQVTSYIKQGRPAPHVVVRLPLGTGDEELLSRRDGDGAYLPFLDVKEVLGTGCGRCLELGK